MLVINQIVINTQKQNGYKYTYEIIESNKSKEELTFDDVHQFVDSGTNNCLQRVYTRKILQMESKRCITVYINLQ